MEATECQGWHEKMTGMLCFLASSMIGPMMQGLPNKCVTMMAFVLGLILAAIVSAEARPGQIDLRPPEKPAK